MSDNKGDFATDVRLLRISAIAAAGGALSTVAADFLLHLIRLFNNLFFFQQMSASNRSPALNTLGLVVIAVPVIGGLLVGLIARFGSEQVRGHGIPEAIEAILFGKSKMSPKVAILKPLASAIAKQNPSKNLETKFAIKDIPYAIGLRKGEPALEKWLNEWITANLKNGKLPGIYQQWVGSPMPDLAQFAAK